MATGKNLRTPIIKPRTQGGTFYTFASAMEDIGLNINDGTNIVKLSHYVLLDIPTFGVNSGVWKLHTNGSYPSTVNVGDYIFAEYLQDAILNMETALRNDEGYNFAATKTVSERVFWKHIFKDRPISGFSKTADQKYYYENPSDAIAKGFGIIASGSQRSDSYGIYNETFVQIPSSYGQMRVLYKPVNDENYSIGKTYDASTSGKIEGIQPSEIDSSGNIKITGICATSICDNNSTHKYTSTDDKDVFEVVLDIETLRTIYNDQTLTYDDIGFGNVGDSMPVSYNFNAILVYYTVYDSTGQTALATNAYGIYIMNNSVEASAGDIYYLPELNKAKTTSASTGTSFSFRINIKPSSAFSGDITVTDNSTGAFSESEDFNEVIRNLSDAIQIMKRNTKTLYAIANNDEKIKNFAADAMAKVNEFESTINSIKLGDYFSSANTEEIYQKSFGQLPQQGITLASSTLKHFHSTYDSSGNVSLTVDSSVAASGTTVKNIIDNMTKVVGGSNYYDLSKIIALLNDRCNYIESVLKNSGIVI